MKNKKIIAYQVDEELTCDYKRSSLFSFTESHE
jgi:hypothetical protein